MSADASDLSRLTGLRSGKNSYYPAFIRSNERMQRTVRAMDGISRAVVRTADAPHAVLEAVAVAAAGHLSATWVVLGLSDGHVHGARPRYVAVGPDGEMRGEQDALPAVARRELSAIRAGHAVPTARTDAWTRVPMYLESRRVGGLSIYHPARPQPESEDLAALRVLAGFAAMALHTSEQHRQGVMLHRQAHRLKREAQAQAHDLAQRTAELHATEQRLAVAIRRELIDDERHRIARELHDSVTQYVLSAGMAVELARGEAEAAGSDGLASQLDTAKSLTQTAVEQMRSAIYALTAGRHDEVGSLQELIKELVAHHTSLLNITLVAEGEDIHLGDAVHHEIARAVGEALFNVLVHTEARRVTIRLRYRADDLFVSIADDGSGDPKALRRVLRLEQAAVGDGRHRGLANMDERIRSIGGSLAFRRASMGGVRVVLRIPLAERRAAQASS